MFGSYEKRKMVKKQYTWVESAEGGYIQKKVMGLSMTYAEYNC